MLALSALAACLSEVLPASHLSFPGANMRCVSVPGELPVFEGVVSIEGEQAGPAELWGTWRLCNAENNLRCDIDLGEREGEGE